MSRARFAFALLALAACTKEAPSVAPASASSPGIAPSSQPSVANAPTPDVKGAPTVTATTPLVLTVSTLAEARLENLSTKPQPVLHSLRFQASRLHLYSASGSELPAEDQRDVMKFDPTVHREDYQVLDPGGKLKLFTATIQASEASFDLTWGPFSFGGLKRGEYDAVLEWESARDDYADESGSVHKLAGVWQGTLRSAHFKVKIP